MIRQNAKEINWGATTSGWSPGLNVCFRAQMFFSKKRLFSASSCYTNHRSNPNQTTHLPLKSFLPSLRFHNRLWQCLPHWGWQTALLNYFTFRPGLTVRRQSLTWTNSPPLSLSSIGWLFLKSVEFSSPGHQLDIRLFSLNIHKITANSQNDHATNLLRLDLLKGPVMTHQPPDSVLQAAGSKATAFCCVEALTPKSMAVTADSLPLSLEDLLFWFVQVFCFIETWYWYIAQASLELTLLLP